MVDRGTTFIDYSSPVNFEGGEIGFTSREFRNELKFYGSSA